MLVKTMSMSQKKANTGKRKFFFSQEDNVESVVPETFEDSFDDALDAVLEEREDVTVSEEDFVDPAEIEAEAYYDDDFQSMLEVEGMAATDTETKDTLSPEDLDAIAAAAAKPKKKKSNKAQRQKTKSQKNKKSQSVSEEAPKRGVVGVLETLTPWVVWGSIVCVIGSLLFAVFVGGANWVSLLILSGGILAFFILLLLGGISNAFSPLMLTGVLFRRARGLPHADAIQLAGKDILHPLGIAEDVLDVDADARLVTTRDGVVMYANAAYMAIAGEAAIQGASGLPPRLDRLFAQAGPESRKIFRLCRAAKSGLATEEVITQLMGAGKQARLRRFEVNLRPMAKRGRDEDNQYVAWRLRELAVEEVADTLASAYHEFPRAVMGLEPSGRIAWFNQVMADFVGTSTRTQLHMSDIVLGEHDDIVSDLWDEEDGEPMTVRVRSKAAGALDVRMTPFHRGGVGEGFLCVEMMPDIAELPEQSGLSGDVTEAPFGVAVVEGDIGSDARVVESNRMFAETFGIDEKSPLLDACFRAEVIRDISTAIKNRGASSALARPVEVPLGEGADARFMALYARPVKRKRGSYGKRRTVLYAVDVTFQKRMEEDYSQDQKLKTIGHLAGSIAHDFNNVLLVIMGSVELLMRRHTVGDPSYPDLVQIQQNSQRARNLTRNLLAFSRKQTLQSEVMSVTEMLREFSPFLNRTISERVKLDVINGRGLPKVKADKGQLELAIMNLAVNARDAMPNGGKLTVETKLVPSSDVSAYGYAVLDDVDQVLIEVSDSGSGVPEDIADKIFEPFFTTKGEGKGTGLGLSTVYGVIGQMGGRIFLHNRPGDGATFRIFLPAYAAGENEAETETDANNASTSKRENADLTGRGRILIVEDEDGARGIIVRALQMCGYEIVEACDGDEALEIIEETDEPFDLILSDIMMPEMDGPTLVQTASERIKDAKVIFMSGYAEGAMREKLDQIKGAGYLQKPFTLKTVAAKVKEALAG